MNTLILFGHHMFKMIQSIFKKYNFTFYNQNDTIHNRLTRGQFPTRSPAPVQSTDNHTCSAADRRTHTHTHTIWYYVEDRHSVYFTSTEQVMQTRLVGADVIQYHVSFNRFATLTRCLLHTGLT